MQPLELCSIFVFALLRRERNSLYQKMALVKCFHHYGHVNIVSVVSICIYSKSWVWGLYILFGVL